MVEGTCAVLAESGLPHSFWGEALLSFVDVWNRLPSNSTRGRSLKATPYELWHGSKPDFSHLRVWGCRAYAHVQHNKHDKLQWHMIKGVFIGYPEGYKGWRIWDGKKVTICETVVFDERYFPHSKLAPSQPMIVNFERPPEPTLDAELPDLGGNDDFTQRPGFDYFEVFAGTPRFEAIRAVLALAACEDHHLRFIDVSNAFLNGEIDAEVYMRQPEGFERGGKNMVLRLNKAIYGLKQASRQWKEKLVHILVDQLGFKEIYSDASLYVYAHDGLRITVPVYVDDGMMSSNSTRLLDFCVYELSKHVKLRNLGAHLFLLGMLIERDRPNRLLAISQCQYILDMLVCYKMDKCDTVKTPMIPSLRLSKAQGAQTNEEIEAMRAVPYSEVVGSLLYLAHRTRPDITYVFAFLSRFVASPGKAHWQAIKHLFQGTKHMRYESSLTR